VEEAVGLEALSPVVEEAAVGFEAAELESTLSDSGFACSVAMLLVSEDCCEDEFVAAVWSVVADLSEADWSVGVMAGVVSVKLPLLPVVVLWSDEFAAEVVLALLVRCASEFLSGLVCCAVLSPYALLLSAVLVAFGSDEVLFAVLQPSATCLWLETVNVSEPCDVPLTSIVLPMWAFRSLVLPASFQLLPFMSVNV
jgi:hypothetical protein